MTYLTNVDILNQEYQVTTHSANQTTSSSANTYTTITGSEISFTPHSDATYVIYEIGFYAQVIDYQSFQHVKFEYSTNSGSSWAEFDPNLGKNFGPSASGDYYRNLMYLKYVIEAWSGARQLRISSGAHQANRQTEFHQVTDWDGSGSVTDKFCNTNLIVYSV